jgi:predicted Zn-dependent protease
MRSALKKFKKAFKLLPEPQKSYPTGTWLLTMMADINFSMKRYKAALHKLEEALEFPEGAENPFIQLRLGQASFEVDELEAAQKHLQIAYEIEGLSIFEDEDPKYSSLLDIKP